jgi:hypothetical protein
VVKGWVDLFAKRVTSPLVSMVVIASGAKQSIAPRKERMDCFVALLLAMTLWGTGMHIKSIAVACLMVPVLWVVMSAPSLASPICWIDHIAKANGGIDVYFIQKASLRIGVKENSAGISFRHTASNGVVRDENGHTQDHLFVKDGVEFYASQLAHDSCSFKVSADEEIGKVTARSAMNLPGLQPIFTTQTIGTDGTVSETAASPSP